MRTLRHITLSLTLIALAMSAAFAQAQFGILRCVVKMEDGTPCPGAVVMVKVGDEETRNTLNDEGSFQKTYPAGPATVTCNDEVKTVQIAAGEVNVVEFEIKYTGVVIQANDSNGTPADIAISVEYKVPGGIRNQLPNMRIGKGKFWYHYFPNDATSLLVTASGTIGNANRSWRTLFTFDGPAPVRKLRVDAPKAFPLSLRILDADGKTMPNAAVNGRITIFDEKTDFWWNPANRKPQSLDYAQKQTDAEGKLSLDALPVGSYEITLFAGEQKGKPVKFTIDEQGKASIDSYTMNMGPRDVTQTVFGKDGKPAPNSAVRVSYAAGGKWILRDAISDANGKVTWKALPPVRAIVWGDKVPAGVIPPDAKQVTEALPAPEPGGRAGISFRMYSKFDKPSVLCIIARKEPPYPDVCYSFPQQAQPDGAESTLRVSLGNTDVQNSLIFAVGSSPLQWFHLENVYIPYATSPDEIVEYSFAMQEVPSIHGVLRTADKELAGVNKLGIRVIQPTSSIPRLSAEELKQLGFLTIAENQDGSFDVNLPATGDYRLFVDLFDNTMPTIPALNFTAKPGKQNITFTLPAPLLEAPAGSTVFWLPANAPVMARQLHVKALNPTMPVFGPKEAVLALCHRPSPDKLLIYANTDGKLEKRELAMRSVKTFLFDSQGKPTGGRMRLNPLLPIPIIPPSDNIRELFGPEMIDTTVYNGVFTDLWPGSYSLWPNYRADDNWQPTETLDIPATGDAEAAYKYRDPDKAPSKQRTINLKFPDGDYTAIRQRPITITGLYDLPTKDLSPYDRPFSTTDITATDHTAYKAIPAHAKKITIICPGMGIIRDVPIPPAEDPEKPTQVVLPAWDKGVTVSGKVLLGKDGKPYANSHFYVSLEPFAGRNISIATDANGAFTIENILPGSVFVHCQYIQYWRLEVPEKGLTDVSLRMPEQASEEKKTSSFKAPFATEADRLKCGWWLPDGGKPMRIPCNIELIDFSIGTGWYWAFDGTNGRASNGRYTNGIAGDSAPPGPSVGIYFPFDPEACLPGGMKLIGLEERAGLEAEFSSPSWFPCPTLGYVLGQIDAVPPGKYTLLVDTARGVVEKQITVTEEGCVVKLRYPAKGK